MIPMDNHHGRLAPTDSNEVEDAFAPFRLSEIVANQQAAAAAKSKEDVDANDARRQRSDDDDKDDSESSNKWRRLFRRRRKRIRKDNCGGDGPPIQTAVSVLASHDNVDTAADDDDRARPSPDAASATMTDLLGSQFYWQSPADDIFSDFDLSAIVRDYEKLQQRRTVHHHNRDKNDLGDDNNDDPEQERLHMWMKQLRYRNVKEWWLDNFPRCHGLIFRVLIPQWIILLIAMGFGYVLAEFEIDDEYRRNDAVLARRFLVDQYPREAAMQFLFGLPTICLNIYLAAKGQAIVNNSQLAAANVDASMQQQSSSSSSSVSAWFEDDFPPVNFGYSDNVTETLEEIQSYMQVCEETATNVTTSLLNYTAENFDLLIANSVLTFDWIRCWNSSIYGDVNPFRATDAQIEAAKRQPVFYTNVWKADQVRLYDQYLADANCTTIDCQKTAYNRSIDDATGSSMCGLNNGAAAWFWFTVMTTVGYGNLALSSEGGRTLVACLAWVSILTWGMILYVAGQVMSIIMDDFFRKCRLRFMTRNIFSALFWGFLGFVWIVIMSELMFYWWSKRQPSNGDVDRSDSLWWAYISILTVGLGDYYLEPEFIFFQDLFVWAFVFLIGFTCLSTFINQVSELCRGVFPDSGEALKERLRNTNLVGLKAVRYKEKNEKALQNIGQLVDKMDDDSVGELLLRLTRIRQKKELLIHLLYQTQDELDYFTQRGEKYEDPPLPRVTEEENMLSEVLDKTSRERQTIEHYRERIVNDSTEYCEQSDVNAREGNMKKRGTRPLFVPLAAVCMMITWIPCANGHSSTELPGMIPSTFRQSNDEQSISAQYPDPSFVLSGQPSSDDDGEGVLDGDDDDSSSEWDDTLLPPFDENGGPPSSQLTIASTPSTPNAIREPSARRIENKVRPIPPAQAASRSQAGPSSKPLRTLEKLQQLLDETDYMTTSSSTVTPFREGPSSDNGQPEASTSKSKSATAASTYGLDPLWTRKDRQKYKKQQYFQEQMQRQQQYQPQYSDNEDVSDTDDGLGYTLPNLPVYLSDDEGDSVGPLNSPPSAFPPSQLRQRSQYPPLTSQQQQQAAAVLAHQQFLQQQRDLYLAQQQYQLQLQMLQQQQLLPPTDPNMHNQAGFSYPTPRYSYSSQQLSQYAPYQERQSQTSRYLPPNQEFQSQILNTPNPIQRARNSEIASWHEERRLDNPYDPFLPNSSIIVAGNNELTSQPPPSSGRLGPGIRPQPLMLRIWKVLLSTQRILICTGLAALVSYASVSPRSLHFVAYNQKFYENFRRVALVVLPPLFVYGWSAVDWSGGLGKEHTHQNGVTPSGENSRGGNPVHHLIRAMSRSFTWGYVGIFVLEIALTTFLRLAVFAWLEPDLFGPPLSPHSGMATGYGIQDGASLVMPPPAWLILPWVLREHKFRVKRITLLVADFLTSCVAAPIVEEVAKLLLLQWTIPLSKNFKWTKRSSKHSKGKLVAEPISPEVEEASMDTSYRFGQKDGIVTYINPYISGMLAVSLGLKWADAIRRVCMYTKTSDEHKGAYALLRGLFPVQELCGCMTALRLARRDVLGQTMPLWSILLPSVVVHGMANFRGMKPFFKWNSVSPWSEMQLSRDTFSSETLSVLGGAASSANDVHVSASGVKKFAQWLGKEFPRITWLIILFRVAGYCLKNYYMINRQAYKRISTYAGKHAAFSAELETAQKLKQSAKDKKR